VPSSKLKIYPSQNELLGRAVIFFLPFFLLLMARLLPYQLLASEIIAAVYQRGGGLLFFPPAALVVVMMMLEFMANLSLSVPLSHYCSCMGVLALIIILLLR
jgi:hypothetical protein